jgi:cyclic-di-GMP phosphodiesterase, flagellum assembly factor TipF
MGDSHRSRVPLYGMYLGEEQIMTRNQTASQTVVVVAMGLVAGACAVALNRHAGMPGPVAATAALSAYLLLLTVHALAWRKASRGTSDVARTRGIQVATGRRKTEATAPKMPAPGPQLGPLGQAPLGGLPVQPPVMPGSMKAPAAAGPQFGAPQGLRSGQPSMPPAPEQKSRAPLPPAPPPMPPQQPTRQSDRGAPPPLPMPAAAPPQVARATPPPMPAATSPTPPRPSDDDLQDIWSFRPASTGQKLPPFVTGRAASTQIDPKLPEPQASTPRPADVEVIQDAIKRLLEEVNAAEQSRNTAPGHPATTGSAPPPLPHPEASIDRSIDALRMTAGSMRAAIGPETAPVPAPAMSQPQPPPVPAPPQAARPHRPTPSGDARARLMADAISAGRIDVTLEPILGLEDQQTRHYEVTVRLRDADGNALDVTPNGPDLRGTGLLPLFDGVRVARTAAVARRLEDRGKGGSIFSMFSGESVADEHFLGELAETLHLRGSLASQLVLSFTQTDVRGFSTPEWDSLADMRALGFRFAITHMTDLDMDFEALADQGFVFAKLDASVFLTGLPAPSGHIPSADVCRHLASQGLTLVVEHIENDEQLARIFGFGVLLGQGQLFGGARPVRSDVVNDRPRGANTAAA